MKLILVLFLDVCVVAYRCRACRRKVDEDEAEEEEGREEEGRGSEGPYR